VTPEAASAVVKSVAFTRERGHECSFLSPVRTVSWCSLPHHLIPRPVTFAYLHVDPSGRRYPSNSGCHPVPAYCGDLSRPILWRTTSEDQCERSAKASIWLDLHIADTVTHCSAENGKVKARSPSRLPNDLRLFLASALCSTYFPPATPLLHFHFTPCS